MKNKWVGKKGIKKLMSEITAIEKKQQTENWATGKLGNGKWAGREKGQHKVSVVYAVVGWTLGSGVRSTYTNLTQCQKVFPTP